MTAAAPASNKALTAALKELDRPIAALYGKTEDWMLGGTLHICVCGAPTFQQPCETCGYYPYGDDRKEYARCAGKATKEGFIRAVEAAGNIAAYWLRNKKQTCAYRDNPTYKALVDEAIEKTKTMPWPAPERLWNAFEGKRKEGAARLQAFQAEEARKVAAREAAIRRAQLCD